MENKPNISEYRYISLAEASELVPYSQEYLSLRVRQGKLKAIKDGRTWRTTKEWLGEYCSQPGVARVWNQDAFSKIHENGKGENFIVGETGKEEEVLRVSSKDGLAVNIREFVVIGLGVVWSDIKARIDKIKKSLINFLDPFLWNWQERFIKAFLAVSLISFLSALSLGGLALTKDELRTRLGKNIETALVDLGQAASIEASFINWKQLTKSAYLSLGQREISFLTEAVKATKSRAENLFIWLGGTLTHYGQLSEVINLGLVNIAEKFYPPTNILVVATEPINISSGLTSFSQAADLIALKAEIEKLKKTTFVVKEITNEISRNIKIENVQRVEQFVLPAGSYSTPDDVAALESRLLGVISRIQVNAQQAANYYTTNSIYSWAPSQRINQLYTPTIYNGATFSAGPIRFTDVDLITQTGSGQVSFSGNVDALSGLDVGGVFTVSNNSTSTITGDVYFDTNTLVVDSLNNRIGVATSSPFATLSVVGDTYLDGALTVTGSIDFISTATTTFNGPIASRSGNFIVASAGTTNNLLLNPYGGNIGIGTTTPNWLLQVNGTRPSLVLSDYSASANLKHWLLSSMGGNLYVGTSTDSYATSTPAALTILNNGYFGLGTSTPSQYFSVNGNGYFTGNLLASGSTGLSLSGVGSGLTFSGTGNHDITASGGTLRIGSNTIIGNIQALNNTVDIGTPDVRFDMIYATEVNATTLVGTISGGNVSAETLTINSDNTVTADLENSFLVFTRGSLPGAHLKWNAASSAKRFEFNEPIYIQDSSLTAATSTLLVQGWSGQSTDIFRVASSSAETNSYFNVNYLGLTGIGTTSPWGLLSVNANGLVSGTPQFVVGSSTRTDFIITQNGNVGIGTTNPSSLLTVAGDVQLTSSAATTITTSGIALVLQQTGDAYGTSKMTILNRQGFGGAMFEGTNDLVDFIFKSSAGGSQNIRFEHRPTYVLAGNTSGEFEIGSTGNRTLTVGDAITSIRTGNVGIGTTSPWGKLSITGADTTAAGKAFVVADSNNSPKMVIQNDGNVGIGTTNPGAPLHIYYTGNNTTLGNSTALMIGGNSGGSTVGNRVEMNLKTWNNATKPAGTIGLITTANDTHEKGDLYFAVKTSTADAYPVEAMRIQAGGNVGIGTTSPWGKLAINQFNGGLSPLFTIASSTGSLATSTLFIVDSQGNVGIGTTSPSDSLNVYRATTAGGILVEGAAGINARLTFANANVAHGMTAVLPTNQFGSFQFLSPTDGGLDFWGVSDTSNTAVGFNGVIGSTDPTDTTPAIYFRGMKKLTTSYQNLADAETVIQFRNNATNLVTILGSGNVGIGTVAPSTLLEVSKTGVSGANANALTLTAAVTGTDVDTTVGLNFNLNQNASNYTYAAIRAGEDTGTGQIKGALRFLTEKYSGGAVLTEWMRITSSGNVGIGTTAPGSKLAINQFNGGLSPLFTIASSTGSLATSTLFIVNSNGNVGIGTTGPLAKLDIAGKLRLYDTAIPNAGDQTSSGYMFSGGTYPSGLITEGGGEIISYGINVPQVGTRTTTGSGGLFRLDTRTGGASLNGNSHAFIVKGYSNGSASSFDAFITDLDSGDTALSPNKGNVGIGTTTPMSLLSLKGTASPQLTVAYSDTKYATFTTDSNGLLTIAGNNGAGGNVLVDTGSNFGIGTDTPFALLSVDAPAGQASFIIGSSTTYMVVNNVGNVGIGTASPGNALHIVKDNGGLTLDTATAGTIIPVLQFSTVGTAKASIQYRPDAPGMAFQTGGYAYPANTKMTILDNGKVGIGSTTPYLTLSVTGTAGGNNAWTNWSHSSMKENFADVQVLDKIAQLNLKEWQYKTSVSEDNSRHLSPFSENFRSQFGLGSSDYMIQSLDVAGVALKGVQELYVSSSPLFSGINIASGISTSTSFMYVNALGSVGIGTTSPSTSSGVKLSVGGDIAATGFVNISTREAKKDVVYLTADDYASVLAKISEVKVATYYYNSETECPGDSSSPYQGEDTGGVIQSGITSPNPSLTKEGRCTRRLGLIAEEAPREVLSADGQGVDLYKLASFTLMGVKALDTQVNNQQSIINNQQSIINSLETKVMTLEKSGSVGGGTDLAQLVASLKNEKITFDNGTIGSFISGALAGILDGLKNLGVTIEQGIVKTQNLFADILQIRKMVVNISPFESKDPTVGTAQIIKGAMEVYVANNQMSATSKIFITPKSAQPVLAVVCQENYDETSGQLKGFKVCLAEAAPELVKVNWWIIETATDEPAEFLNASSNGQSGATNDSNAMSSDTNTSTEIIMSSSDEPTSLDESTALSEETAVLPVTEDLSTSQESEPLPSALPSVTPEVSPEPTPSTEPVEVSRLPIVEE